MLSFGFGSVQRSPGTGVVFQQGRCTSGSSFSNHVRRLSSMNTRIRVSNERLMYVYIRDLQMPMRTALGMNAQR